MIGSADRVKLLTSGGPEAKMNRIKRKELGSFKGICSQLPMRCPILKVLPLPVSVRFWEPSLQHMGIWEYFKVQIIIFGIIYRFSFPNEK